MAEAKTKKATDGEIIETLDGVLAKMVQEAEANHTDSVIQNEEHRQCIAKLDTVIKFIKARW